MVVGPQGTIESIQELSAVTILLIGLGDTFQSLCSFSTWFVARLPSTLLHLQNNLGLFNHVLLEASHGLPKSRLEAINAGIDGVVPPLDPIICTWTLS
jgi:hypothetical protein